MHIDGENCEQGEGGFLIETWKMLLDVQVDSAFAVKVRNNSFIVGQDGRRGECTPNIRLESLYLGSSPRQVRAVGELALHGGVFADLEEEVVVVGHGEDGVGALERFREARLVFLVCLDHFHPLLDERLCFCAFCIASHAPDAIFGVVQEGIDHAATLAPGCASDNDKFLSHLGV